MARPTAAQLRLIAVYLVVGVASGAFVEYGRMHQWGAEQWGPLAAWFAGIATVAAVLAALRQARIAREQAVIAQQQAVIAQRQANDARRDSLRSQFDRLVDHEMSRRRECIDALSEFWGEMINIGLEFRTFTEWVDSLDETFDPKQQRTPSGITGGKLYGDELIDRVLEFVRLWAAATQPPLFRALLVLRGTPLYQGMTEARDGIAFVARKGFATISLPIGRGSRPDTKAITTMVNDVLYLREQQMRLAEEHFSLERADVDAAVRRNQTPQDGLDVN